MKKQPAKRQPKPADDPAPVEIPMTDLGLSADGRPDPDEAVGDRYAAGTPGGGTASGGLAGTNAGDGDPDDADLEDALGSGIHDTGGDEEGGPPYSGPSGGAVGGTPAEKRAKGSQ